MIASDHRHCRDCGAPFKRSRADAVVRCPACRKPKADPVPAPVKVFDVVDADGNHHRVVADDAVLASRSVPNGRSAHRVDA